MYDIIDPNGSWNAKSLPSEEFDLQLCNQALSLREQRRAKMAQRPPGEPWDEADLAMWQTRLGYAPLEVTKRTLKATTQQVELEENHSSFTVMQDHFKKRFPGLGCKRVQEML